MSTDRLATFKSGVHVVWCERCEQWTLLGQPYEMLEPGRFAHAICPVRGSRFTALGRLRLVRGGGYSGTVALGIVAAIELVSGVVTLSPLRAGIGAVLAVLLIIEQSITGGPVPPCSKEHR